MSATVEVPTPNATSRVVVSKKRTRAFVLIVALSAIATIAGPPNFPRVAAAQTGDVSVDVTDVRQRIDGFGASDRKNPLLTDADADLFFSISRGIGLSILRASIDPNGQYFGGNWTNATKAAARGAVVWAGPWSPPAAWKDNNDVNNGGHLLLADYDAWAARLANFAVLLQQNTGVPLYGVSVQNEPDYSASYNSALYTTQQMVDFIKVLGPKLATLNPRPKLLTPDVASWGVLWNYSDAIGSDPVAASYTDVLATHQYFAIDPTPHAVPPGKMLWQTEMSSFDGPSTDITNGITVARWVHNALVDGSVNAWHYWWLIGISADNEGLLNIGREPTKRLYTFGNFSRFIRPGFVRVGASGAPAGVYTTAYRDPVTNTLVIVAINDSGGDVPLGVTLNGITIAAVTPWVTSATEDLAPHPSIAVTGGRFATTLTAASVTTFVSGSGVAPTVTSVSPLSGATGTSVTVTGSNFGSTQGASTIRFNGADATPTSWSDTTIVAPLPSDASTGPVIVAVNGVPSNGVLFTSTTNSGAYVFDIFSGANGTPLSAHVPNTGATWVDDAPGNTLLSNELESMNFVAGHSHNTAAPTSPDYEVSVDVTMNVTGYGNRAGVEGRVQTDRGDFGNTKYVAYFSEGSRIWSLDKWLGGNATTLGTYADTAFTSGTKKMKLGMVGGTITVYVDGTPVISVNDSSVQTTGYPGIFNAGGIHNGILLDNYLVTGTSPPSATPTSTAVPTTTGTAVPTVTGTTVPTGTSTPVPTATSTPVPTGTSTPVPTTTSTAVPTASTTPPSYTSSANVSPATVSAGSTVSITASVSSPTAATVGIAIILYDPSGALLSHTLWYSESFAAGQTKPYTAQWTVPALAAQGRYAVTVGVASVGWGTWYSWNTNAGSFTVQ